MEPNPRLHAIKTYIQANGGWPRRAWRMPTTPARPPRAPAPSLQVFLLQHQGRRFIVRAATQDRARARLNLLLAAEP